MEVGDYTINLTLHDLKSFLDLNDINGSHWNYNRVFFALSEEIVANNFKGTTAPWYVPNGNEMSVQATYQGEGKPPAELSSTIKGNLVKHPAIASENISVVVLEP